MRTQFLIAIFLVALGGCVSKQTWRTDVLAAYRKGFRVGRVVGRDQVISDLKSPDCFKQSVNDLMNPDETDIAVPQGGK